MVIDIPPPKLCDLLLSTNVNNLELADSINDKNLLVELSSILIRISNSRVELLLSPFLSFLLIREIRNDLLLLTETFFF